MSELIGGGHHSRWPVHQRLISLVPWSGLFQHLPQGWSSAAGGWWGGQVHGSGGWERDEASRWTKLVLYPLELTGRALQAWMEGQTCGPGR